ncbi:MAG TPA: fused MFS/spermidine synthase [Candidatus Polarisedimenticolaceae bacterium]|nr:fused MFS/spermidine synthase [Candidatus Polarisedimenticolaceae bacterium]
MTRADESARLPAAAKWVMLIYFLSGVCSLMDEVVWVRLLKLTLGNTVYATTVVVSVFMGGLALGAWCMSRYADRIARRLHWYAVLETIATASALAVPWLLALADRVYVWFFRAHHPAHGTLLFVQVLLSAAIILVPSITMGSTLPLLARFVTGLERESGRLVGRLYALNTMGAACGCFLAGFLLIRAIGVMGTLSAAAALHLVVAAAGWRLSRRRIDETEPEPVAPSGVAAPAASFPVSFPLLAAAFFLSGFVSIGYEIGWFRSVVFLLGGDTYVFTSVLTVYLLGNVVGAAIGSRLVPRLANPAAAFAVTLALLGLSGALYFPLLVVWTERWAAPLGRGMTWVAAHSPLAAALVKPLGHSLGLFLLPSALMGVGFPIALQAWAARVHRVGRSTGAAYAANTIGAVLGGVVTGFVLIPALGMQRSVMLLGLVLVLVAAALYLTAQPRPLPRRRWLVALTPVVLVTLAMLTTADRLLALIEASPWLKDELQTVSVREGVTATVTVHRDETQQTLHLYSSGHSIAGDTFALRGDQKALGHFGVLLNPTAREVLSVGFGSGETTKCLSDHGLDRIDCVEVAPEVVRSSLEYFRHLNLADRLDEEVELIFMDAKNFVHLTDRSYDVVVNDSIHPRDFAENASLYGKEYFEAIRRRLNPGGLMVSWLPTYHMSARDFDSILGTLMDAFPHVSLWYLIQNPAPLVVLVASEGPQRYAPAAIDDAIAQPAIGESLAVIGIHDAIDLLNCYMGDERELRPIVRDYAVNSDYTPFIEFSTEEWTPADEMYQRFVLDIRGESIFDHLDLSGFDDAEAAAWLAEFRGRHRATGLLAQSLVKTNELERLKLITDALGLAPGDLALLRALDGSERTLVGKGQTILETEGADRALGLADVILAIHPESSSAWLIRSTVMHRRGDLPRALFAARKAVEMAPDSDEARDHLAELTAELRSAGG